MSDNFDITQDLVLFFTPEADVIPHFSLQCIIAKNLELQGYKTIFAFCPALFCRCPVMDMYSLSFASVADNKKNVCMRCATVFHKVLEHYSLAWVNLNDYLPQGAHEIAQHTVEKAPQNRVDLVFESVPVGKIAIGDYAIGMKHWPEGDLDTHMIMGWESYARSVVITYLSLNSLCEQLPIKRIIRYNDYANNMAATFAGNRHGIPVFTISHASHRGVDLQTATISPKLGGALLKEELKNWHLWRDLPLPPKTINEITLDTFDRFLPTSSLAYSPAKTNTNSNIRDDLGLTPNKKLLVAFTSSGDELRFLDNLLELSGYEYASPPKTFANQIDWLQFLIKYVENSDDLELVVRVHPREGASGRYQTKSHHLELLLNEFNKKYNNTHFIWPDEKISSYDLMEIADVGLTSWSTIGIEMARVGVPLVTAFPGISFPADDFHKWGGPTENDYIKVVRESLKLTPSLISLAKAYRCYNAYRLGSSFSIADIIPNSNYRELVDSIPLAQEAKTIVQTIIQLESMTDINRQRLRSQEANALSEELDTLVSDLKRILWLLFYGEDLPQNIAVQIGEPPNKSSGDNSFVAYIYSQANSTIVLETDTTLIHRFSPLGTRLIKILENHGGIKYYRDYCNSESALSLLC